MTMLKNITQENINQKVEHKKGHCVALPKPKVEHKKGHCVALPMRTNAIRAKDTLLARIEVGTARSYKLNVNQHDAKPKSSSMPDMLLMRDVSRVELEAWHYTMPSHNVIDLFCEFLRIRKIRAERNAQLIKEEAQKLAVRLNSQEHRLLKRAISRGENARIEEILKRAMMRIA